MVELEAIVDGARASQLPPFTLPDSADAQVFADPVQSDEQFIEGRPRTTMRRRIAIVPLKPGALSLPGPRIEWWDADQGVARTAMLPPLQLQVAPGEAAPALPDEGSTAPAGEGDRRDASASPSTLARSLPWVLLAIAAFAWWRLRRRAAAVVDGPGMPAATKPPTQSLAAALKQDDLGAIAQAFCIEAGSKLDDLDAVRARLDDHAQRDAVERMQAARWGEGDAALALAALRAAFAKGARWRRPLAKPPDLLPPLYPE